MWHSLFRNSWLQNNYTLRILLITLDDALWVHILSYGVQCE